MSNVYHTPVLLESVIEYLITAADGIYVDATIGGGGHADAILERLTSRAKLVGFDADSDAIEYTKQKLTKYERQITLIRENFTQMKFCLQQNNIDKVNGALFDLGVSSFQLDGPDKGFSFQRDERLDMRMDKRLKLDAAALVTAAEGKKLETVFREYGEERHSRRIAKAIVRERTRKPIHTSALLAALVEQVVGRKFARKSIARIFQALRIEVNDELNNLQRALRDAIELLEVGGRIVVISYHSLEDRIVKEFFKSEAAGTLASGHKLVPDVQRVPRLNILTRKPVRPSEEEIRTNSRARSAMLRAAERVGL